MMSTVDRTVRDEFRKTLRRFGIIKTPSLLEAMEEAALHAINNFGVSDQIYVSPKTYEALKGLDEQIDE